MESLVADTTKSAGKFGDSVGSFGFSSIPKVSGREMLVEFQFIGPSESSCLMSKSCFWAFFGGGSK